MCVGGGGGGGERGDGHTSGFSDNGQLGTA